MSKSTRLADLAAAIRAVHSGYVMDGTEEETRALLDDHQQAQLDPGASSLTERERELLSYLARGISSTEELAEELFISQKTVKNHLASIFQKLSVADRTQAAVEAIRLGLGR
jgi:DNA-binding NarL/FixJ family response regulator